ncbi:MAG: hypothetical protein AAB391_03700 [Patescibacteria group bacterium]
MFTTFIDSLLASFSSVWGGVAAVAPRFILTLLLLVVGALIADLVGKAVSQILVAVKLDHLLRTIGVEHYTRRAGLNLHSGTFFGTLVKWFLNVGFLLQALTMLGLSTVTVFLGNVLSYLPQVAVAALVLLAGLVIGELVESVVSALARLASLGRAHLLGNASRWAVWTFSVLVALYQFGLTSVFSETVLNAIVMSLALAAGLAFGLGGQATAGQFLARLRGEMTDGK